MTKTFVKNETGFIVACLPPIGEVVYHAGYTREFAHLWTNDIQDAQFYPESERDAWIKTTQEWNHSVLNTGLYATVYAEKNTQITIIMGE
jgi:hypothetical protein